MYENYTLIASRSISFDAEDGKNISGLQLYFTRDNSDRGWHGTEVIKLFVSDSKRSSVCVDELVAGLAYTVVYNRFGKPEKICLANG